MSAGLHLRDVAERDGSIRIDVTSPTPGVAILDVTIGGESTPAPLHWRAGDWTKPPLDVALGPDGRPESLQVVFQDEVVLPADGPRHINADAGAPLFDIDDWPADRYLDNRTNVRATRLPSGELVVSVGDSASTRRVQVGEGLAIGIDATGVLVEVAIGPLDAEQWRLIEAASP